ncbi:MAG: glycosyltransferase family 2 protein [Treponemataceae bacterium]|nr:MAG: glycosyltransferase family 2 protein [Treponemataceae bacterium]
MDKLYIVIPAYNEQDNIDSVAREWHEVAAATGKESRLVIVDDGSKDGTYTKLLELQAELPRLVPLTKPNGGHGAAVLFGYRYALENGADYVFQTDSDGQTLPSEFVQFWEWRNEYAALIGHRTRRQDGLSRILVTKILKLVLWLIFHLDIPDANTPFRLVKADVLRKHLEKIPPDFNLSNIILTVSLVKHKENILFIPITFRQRQGGVNSINLKKIIKIGFRAVKDFYQIKKGLEK